MADLGPSPREEPLRPDSSGAADHRVIYPSRLKMSLALLASLAFVGAGLWIGSKSMTSSVETWKVVVACYVGVPFFTGAAGYAAWRIVRQRPAVEVDATGITDTASALGAGHLAWDEVDGLVLYKFGGQWMLGIVVKDVDRMLARQNVFKRLLMRANMALGCPPVNIPQAGLRDRLAEFAAWLQAQHGVPVFRSP